MRRVQNRTRTDKSYKLEKPIESLIEMLTRQLEPEEEYGMINGHL